MDPADLLVPLSVLALDLSAPSVGGWPAYLAGRGIEVVADDLGRDSITRADARRLFTERREAEARHCGCRRISSWLRRRRTGRAGSRRCGLLLWAPAGLLLLFLILIAKRCCSIFSPALPLTRR